MARINTKMKRLNRLSTTLRHTFFFKGGANPKKGDRTFKTAEGAEKWAVEVLKLKKSAYTIVPAKKDKKFKIEKIDA